MIHGLLAFSEKRDRERAPSLRFEVFTMTDRFLFHLTVPQLVVACLKFREVVGHKAPEQLSVHRRNRDCTY